MENIKRNKTAQRASFTKAYTKLETALINETAEAEDIEIRLQIFKQKTDSLELIHNKYLDALTDETEFETEFNTVEDYREKALRIELKSKRVLEKIKGKQINSESSISGDNFHLAERENPHKISPRLPEVELYKFGGELRDWLTFWNQFKNIHENKNLTDCDKFHYLIQSTKVKSEARGLIESFPITNENYSLAIESLTERYGRKELLIDFYVRELLKLVLNNVSKTKQDSLSGLYNKLSTQLRALSSLGVTTDQCGIILYPLVESSLPTHILRSFERQRRNIESEQSISSLDAIVLFLKSEVQSEEKIKLSRSEIFPYERERRHLAERQRSFPSAAELFIQESNEMCAFCLKDHATRFCKKAFFIPLEEKIAIIKKKGLCRVCLVKSHLASRCRSQITCQLCSKRHLKFMCPNIGSNKSDSSKQEVNDKNINENTVDSLHSRATNEVILQTLVVNVHGIKKKRKVRAIIDTGSQKSYILKSTAEDLGFNLQREEEFCHSLFGGTKTKMYKHKCYKIYLSNLNDNYICKLDALDHEVICNDICSVKSGSWIHELENKNIFLTDIQENAGPIEVLLGADVAGKLITGRREELETGLVALETKLGWTLMGKVPRYTDEKYHKKERIDKYSTEEIEFMERKYEDEIKRLQNEVKIISAETKLCRSEAANLKLSIENKNKQFFELKQKLSEEREFERKEKENLQMKNSSLQIMVDNFMNDLEIVKDEKRLLEEDVKTSTEERYMMLLQIQEKCKFTENLKDNIDSLTKSKKSTLKRECAFEENLTLDRDQLIMAKKDIDELNKIQLAISDKRTRKKKKKRNNSKS